MQPLRARVRGGRLVLDEPTDLPEGSEVPLMLADHTELDEQQLAALHQAIEEGLDDVEAGREEDAEDVIAQMLARP